MPNVRSVCIALFALSAFGRAPAQDSTSIRLSGSIGAQLDVYDMNSTGATTTFARRPASIFRLNADPTLSVGDWLSIPVNISFTFREAAVIQPSFATPDISSFLQNPLNRLSISPRIGWATFHMGSIVPRYGSLTVDNAQLFGVGVDLRPSSFRIQSMYGTITRPVPVDTLSGRNGTYARTMWAFRIGDDASENSRVGVTVAYMNDDVGSIPFVTQQTVVPVPITDSNGVVIRDSAYMLTQRSALLAPAQEGMAIGIDFRSGFGDGFYVGGEVAAMSFTRDKEAPELSDPIPVISSFMTTRSSTRIDGAAMFEVGYRSSMWGVTSGVKYIGPGYVVLTQPYFQPDHIDIDVSPNITLLEGRLITNATFGLRFTDVSDLLSAGTTQMLLSVNATGVINDAFTLSGSFTNFGYRTTRADDTLRYEQVSTSASLTPSFNVATEFAQHMFSVTGALDVFRDVTQQGVPSSANTTTSLILLYAISPRQHPWSGRASLSFVDNDLSTMRTTMRSISLNGSYRLLDGMLDPDATVMYSVNQIGSLPVENQLALRLGVRSRISQHLSGTLNIQWNSVTTADTDRGRAYSEFIGSVGIRWMF